MGHFIVASLIPEPTSHGSCPLFFLVGCVASFQLGNFLVFDFTVSFVLNVLYLKCFLGPVPIASKVPAKQITISI